MLNLYTPQTARQTILKRTLSQGSNVPAIVLENIQKIFEESLTPEIAVQRILQDIQERGDQALRMWSEKIDQIYLDSFRVPKGEIESALHHLSDDKRVFLEESIRRVETFHRHQPLTSWFTQELGGTVGQIIRPLQRVGLYVPGGSAPLPSSVIMSAIPAKVAGVKDIVVVTPPFTKSNPTHKEENIILAVCALCGINEVYTIGGAQAIAALAYGTESIPHVDKIFGPGNLFVTLAKRQVYGSVGIDGLFGPTETMIIADQAANPEWVAADLLAQAEHDLLASAILLSPSRDLVEKVCNHLFNQVKSLPRKEIVQTSLSLSERSGAVIVNDLNEAVALANEYAPEHLCLAVKDPWKWAEKVQNAGGIFLGEFSFEVLGDYIAGPSHAMPTGGSARFSSPLNVWDFVHIISLVAIDEDHGHQISRHAAAFARAETLEAHARSADLRA